MSEPTLAELEQAAKAAADKVEKFQESVVKESKGKLVTKLTKKQEAELAKLRKEADEAEAKFKAAQAASAPEVKATAPAGPRKFLWLGIFVLIAVVAALAVFLIQNQVIDGEPTTDEPKQAAGESDSDVTIDEASDWLDINNDIEPQPGGPRTTTDINSPHVSFIRPLLVDRHFEGFVGRGYSRSEPSAENPEIKRANYSLSAYLFMTPDDSKIFVGEYTQFWLGRNFKQTGTYAGGVILQDDSHVDLFWPVDNAVLRVNVGGSEDYPLPAASKDAVDVADLVAANACHGCADR